MQNEILAHENTNDFDEVSKNRLAFDDKECPCSYGICDECPFC